MPNFIQTYSLEDLRARTEHALDSALPKHVNEPLAESMRYSTLNGGKRLRAMLVYAAGLALDTPIEKLDAAACAVECIHAYSLIHDDLPAMDDDDLRRGKPTSHKKYDEATAILAGDSLQTFAFELLSNNKDRTLLSAETRLRMISVLAKASGTHGMVGGQMLDIIATQKTISLEQLQHLHSLKTGALIQASTLLGVLCSEKATDQEYILFKHYADNIGLAFQIVDDILDETADTETLGKQAGADKALGKSTYVALLGLDKARSEAHQLIEDALQSLGQLSHNTPLLKELASLVLNRIN
jgi:geranylgeranyl pyrophosphate synthase